MHCNLHCNCKFSLRYFACTAICTAIAYVDQGMRNLHVDQRVRNLHALQHLQDLQIGLQLILCAICFMHMHCTFHAIANLACACACLLLLASTLQICTAIAYVADFPISAATPAIARFEKRKQLQHICMRTCAQAQTVHAALMHTHEHACKRTRDTRAHAHPHAHAQRTCTYAHNVRCTPHTLAHMHTHEC